MAGTGRVIAGRYRLKEPIGRGAMGTVWRGWDEILDREVAVKELRVTDGLPDDERAKAYQRTHREARTAARLSHPGLVTVFDVAEEDGRPWIVMELVHAESLDQIIAKEGPLSPPRAAEAGRQLLSALATAHAAGVLHRDVKPSNVMLTGSGRAVLTDFGIATFEGDSRLTQTGMVMGSPGFTAPERIQGNSATPASDLWSLGATLYAAVEGHGPFDRAGGAITTMSAIINTEPPPAPVAAGLGPVIDALLRRDPAQRPDAATAARMLGTLGPLPEGPAGAYTPTASSYAPVLPRQPEAPPGSGAGAGAGVESVVSEAAEAEGAPELSAAAPMATLAPSSAAPAAASAGVGTVTPDAAPAAAAPGAGAAVAAGPGPVPGTSVDLPAQEETTTPVRQADSRPPTELTQTPPPPATGAAQPMASAPVPTPSSAPPVFRPVPASPAPRQHHRRAILIVAGVLIVVAALVGSLLALRGHGKGTLTGGGSANPTTSSGGGGGTAQAPRTPVEAAAGAASNVLPTGWHWYEAKPAATGTADGFKVAIPDGWQVHESSNALQYFMESPANATFLEVDLTPHTYSNMVAEAGYLAKVTETKGEFLPRAAQSIRPVKIRGQAGSAWSFRWKQPDVGWTRALDLMYIAHTSAANQSFALYMTAPDAQFNGDLATFTEAVRTFQPVS
jgi:tRNA A-37 threonylcarbamoyl transferase component Bud32